MAFRLASAYVEFSQRGMRGVMGAIGTIKRGMGSFVGGAAKVGLAGAAIGAAAIATGAKLVSMSASLEQTTVQFKTLLGSMENAKNLIADLQKFSASTPFQFEGLANTAKTLLAFGTAQEQIIPTMQVLGDVSAATGNDINELAQIYGKVMSRGQLMTEQLDQFNERGVPLGRALADSMGVAETAIRDMASSGQIGFDDLQKALVAMNSEGGIAFQGMADQSQTMSGLWSTAKDNITLLLTDIGDALVEGFDLKTIVQDFTGFVQRFKSEWMPDIIDKVKWVGTNIVKPFVSGIATITNFWLEFFADMDLHWKWLTTHIANQAVNIFEAIRVTFVNAYRIGVWAWDNIGDIARTTSNAIGTFFYNLGKNIKSIWDSVLEFFESGEFKVNWTPIMDGFKNEIKKMPQLAKGEFNQLQGELDKIDAMYAQRKRDRNQRLAAANASDGKGAEKTPFAIGGSGPGRSGGGSGGGRTGFVGVAEFAKQSQEAALKQDMERKQVALAERQVNGIDQLNKKIDQGIRVDVANTNFRRPARPVGDM